MIAKTPHELGKRFKMNGSATHTISAALYLNELVENGRCLCGFSHFFPNEPNVHVRGLDKSLDAIIGFTVYCRREGNPFCTADFSVFIDGSEYLSSYLHYEAELVNRPFIEYKEVDTGKIRSEGWKKLMSLIADYPVSFLDEFNKLIDTTEEYVTV